MRSADEATRSQAVGPPGTGRPGGLGARLRRLLPGFDYGVAAAGAQMA